MDTNTEVLEKRREIKDFINAGLNRTPMAVFLNSAGHLVGRITSNPSPVPLAYSVAILAPLVMVPTLIAVSLFREWEIMETKEWFGVFIVLEGFLVSTLLSYFNVKKVLEEIRDHLWIR